jgi:hypothetical protein
MFELISKNSGLLLLAGAASLATSCDRMPDTCAELSLPLPPTEGFGAGKKEVVSVFTRWGGEFEIDQKQQHHLYQIKLHQSDELVLRARYLVTDEDFGMMAAGVGYIPTLLYKGTDKPYVVDTEVSPKAQTFKSYRSPIFPPGDVLDIEAWVPPSLADNKLTLALIFDNVRDRTYRTEDNEHLIPLETEVIRK